LGAAGRVIDAHSSIEETGEDSGDLAHASRA
jgi:hypothetical protein